MASKTFSLATRLTLANGLSIPNIHLGVYLTSGKETSQAVQWALQAGYRGFDSAQMYGNEREVGTAIINFLNDPSQNTEGLKREDIFYTTKLERNGSFDVARKSIDRSVKESGLGYIDLMLLHSPYGGRKSRLSSWKAVEAAVRDGMVKIGGVSNFGVKHLQELIDSSEVSTPLINQIEVHPFNTRTNITQFCQTNNIQVQAYGPLVRSWKMDHPTIVELSNKYSCTPAQLLVRWSVQHGYIPLPKSVTKERIQSNGVIGFFAIDSTDMEKMDDLDEYLVTDWDPVDTD